MKRISRRTFLAASSAGMAGAYVMLNSGLARAVMGGGMMGGGGGMMGGTSVIDPPVGAPFRDPPELAKDSSGCFRLEARQSRLNINGSSATLLTYNGSYPGPTIRAKKGDTLRVTLVNSLPATTEKNLLGHLKNVTNLHTHGLHVSPEPPADSMAIQLSPRQQYDYSYDLSHEEAGHLAFYHPHVHGVVAEQYWGGLAGALVVEDEDTTLSKYETHLMVLKDLTLSGSAPAPYTSLMEYMHGKEGNMVLVNGQVNPALTIRPGQVQRWQIVNASNARFYNLSLQKHSIYLIGTDGGLLDQPYRQSSLLLSPGERVDVLIKADQGAGNFRFLSLPYDRGASSPMQQVTLLTLACNGTAVNDSLPGVINPLAVRLSMDLSQLPRKKVVLSMMQGRGYINGQSFTDMDHTATLMSEVGGYEVWEIVNQSGMDHPFHQHVNSAQVLSISGGNAAYASLYTGTPAFKDVVIVPKWGSATLLMPVMHYTGMSMFHCHIIEHEDIGMMGVWHLMGQGM